ncbi:SVP1-like protein 2 [Golovinomyces cichoracearum]|uniref:SVP1-like protein 2 n=1 Tax=Golovinomyces cichoracearum TaxID=62708 RepID=A0A420HAI9_9PEZI|nr:SVP1-like protein 2 [Golovinomyces cichoracearum]
MNTRSKIEGCNSPVALSVSFNQDASCFSVGRESGFSVFNSDPCHLRVSRELGTGIGIVQMTEKSNFIGIVGGGTESIFSQNKVIIWDDAKHKIVLRISNLTNVLGIRMSKKHIVVILQNSVHTYKFHNPPEPWQVFETADNFLGLCCLESNILAFPGRTAGQVQLVELNTGNVNIILAHGSSLRALGLSLNGQILATASETGTLIRVFATHSCARIIELRRGVDQAIIFSLAISPSGLLLAATSDKSTLHIFDLPNIRLPSVAHVSMGHQKSPVNTAEVGFSSNIENCPQKWGILGRIPILPRLFSDNYSFASAQFETLDESINALPANQTKGKPKKGIIGWVNDENIIVVGAGSNCKWEKFVITKGDDGRRHCIRDGWKNYLTII